MNITGLIFLLMAHFLSGRGVLRLLRVNLPFVHIACLSMMTGVVILSFVPCVLQLMNVLITATNLIIGIGICTAVLSIPLMIWPEKIRRPRLALPLVYEWPFLLMFLLLVGTSVWRCFYFPPTPRDMLTGPELIAEYTARESSMINSVFSIDLHTTNNYFKSPFITSLQIIYKLLVSSFGQLWLSVLFVSFTVWIYSVLRKQLHPVLAGLMMLFYLAVPDLFAYTYVLLYDYSNLIFFACGAYFLMCSLKDNNTRLFAFSALLFGFATYIRNETLILVALLAPLPLYYHFRQARSLPRAAGRAVVLVLVSAVFYFICVNIFVHSFVPVPFNVNSQINSHLGDVSVFFIRLWEITHLLVFSRAGVAFYSYFIFVFTVLLLADIAWVRRLGMEAFIMLYCILTVYIGLALIGYLLPLADLQNTTKRGMLKLMPLILLYMAYSPLLLRFSGWIKDWEEGNSKKKIPEATALEMTGTEPAEPGSVEPEAAGPDTDIVE